MSRAVKDLRSIINISRLSACCSDDEDNQDTKLSPLYSPDSGICALESRPSSAESLERIFHSSLKPLPSISNKNKSGNYKISSPERSLAATPISMQNSEGNFEQMLTYIDSGIVSNWLQKANEYIDQLGNWYRSKENFISFVNFWLSSFPEQCRLNLYKSEYDILLTEMNQAFNTGIENRTIERRHIRLFLSAVYREYPDKFLCNLGRRLFLDQLRILSCSKEEEYRHLLSDVKCKTDIKQHAQWILAARAYCVISVSYAIISFFSNATNRPQLCDLKSPNAYFDENKFQEQNMLYAINHGSVESVQYLLNSGEMTIDWLDEQNKSLMFHAVISKQPKVLSYLLRQTRDAELINQRADNGNTILHAAIGTERLDLLQIILDCPLVDINSTNSIGGDITPLHVAIVFEHIQAVKLLLSKNADWKLLWESKSCKQHAEDTKNPDLIQIFKDLEN